tara:strand:+ start:276 stop:506 length:231 start_codon:yes stop_codon:yes gene_type:complete
MKISKEVKIWSDILSTLRTAQATAEYELESLKALKQMSGLCFDIITQRLERANNALKSFTALKTLSITELIKKEGL